MGNTIANTVEAAITGSAVTAADNVALAASDLAPSVIPEWIVSEEDMDNINAYLVDSPIDLPSTALLPVTSSPIPLPPPSTVRL
ncbi:MAG: hypothetical protein B5M56_02285 [Desulfococcus sp. 4484_241]|nr:MAG: hypothetical protein B5M56_02285 [Desulfococcus sp. 4484_241]